MAASKTERTTDSKNRRPGCAVITIPTASTVVDGAVVTVADAVVFDSHIYDLDDGERGKHMREKSTVAEAVALGVFTLEEAQDMEALHRRWYNALDYIKENRASLEPAEEPVI